MIQAGHTIKSSTVLIMGITFKENCPDMRNTKVVDIYKELLELALMQIYWNPWAKPENVKHEYDIDLLSKIDDEKILSSCNCCCGSDDFKTFNLKNTKILVL